MWRKCFHAIVKAQNVSMFSAETLGRAQPESLGLYGVFSGRVPVSTYWGFPGPGSQYKSRQHRLGISFLSCWVGPVDSSHLSKKLDRRLGSTAWNVEVQSNLSEREFHCNTRLSNEGQVSTLTCVRVQQKSWSSWGLQIQTNRIFRQGVSWIPLNQVSWYRKQVMNLVTTYALTLCHV